MGGLPNARVRFRGTGANCIGSKMAWRFVVVSCMVLLDKSLAGQSMYAHVNTDLWYGSCEGNTSLIANGVCEISVNTADCDFDGGDCCECTCFLDDGSPCDRAEALFSCLDPAAPTACYSTDPVTSTWSATASYPDCAGYIPHIRDGRCNDANNNAACRFDGGDCCASTCHSSRVFSCGGDRGGEFDCRDPRAAPSRRRLNGETCEGNADDIGNTRCDSSLNNFECGYDGGDCCECTCTPYVTDSQGSDTSTINYCVDGDFDCLDPSANCESAGVTPALDPTPSPVDTNLVCEGFESFIGDGFCDLMNNNLACGWDEGDCCICTCEDLYVYSCLDFDCLDPDAPTVCEATERTPSPTGSSASSSAVTPVSGTTASPGPGQTESPAPSTSASPVPAPTFSFGPSSSLSPLAGPTVSPVSSASVSPAQGPTVSPVPGLAESPAPSRTESPVLSPTVNPVPGPTESPVPSPTETPVPGPTKTPVSGPTESPAMGPTVNSMSSPTENIVPSPTESAVPGQTKRPISGPTGSPVVGPTEYPVPTSSVGPVPGPTDGPVPGPTVRPMPSASEPSTESDSSPYSDSPTEGDTSSSTESRGASEEGTSTSSATLTAIMDKYFVNWAAVAAVSASMLGCCFM